MKGKSLSDVKSSSSSVSVSTASSRTNLSESSSKQRDDYLGWSQVVSTETQSLSNDLKALSTEKVEFPKSGIFDIRQKPSQITLTEQSCSSQQQYHLLSPPSQSKICDPAKQSSVIPDSLHPTHGVCQDDQIVLPDDSTKNSPESESPQLDQLLSDLEEMKLKFRPESLDPHLSGSSDRIHEEDQIYNFSDLSSEDHCPPEVSDVLRVSTSSTTHLATNEDHKQPAHIPMFIQVEPEVIPSFQSSHSKDRYLSPAEMVPVEKSTDLCFEGTEPSINLSFPEDNFQSWKSEENATGTFSSATLPGVPAESQPEIPEEHQTYLCEDNSTSDTLSSQEVDPAESSLNCRGVTEEASIQSIQIDLTHFGQASSVESTQSENIHPQSLSDLTPEMVKHVRHFCFEEILPVASQENFETPTDEKKKPQTCELFSEKALTPNDPECLDAQPISVQPRAEMPLSTTDEGSHISPEYAETSSTNDDYTDKISMKSLPRDSAKSLLETAKEQLNILGKENFSSDILQSQEESALVTNDSRGAADEVSTQSNQDVLAHLGKAVSVESTQSEDLSSQTFSDLTPQTVKHVRHFCFEEMLPSSSSGESSETPPDEARPRISRQFSEERLSPVNADYECLDSQTISLQSKEETTSSTSDDESHMSPAPEYAETSPTRNNDTDKFSALSLPRESMKAQCKTSEDHLPYLYHEDTKTDIQQSPRAESASLTDDSRPEKATFVESTQSEKISSQSLSDLTPDTVENVRHFCFEELLPFSSQGHLETPPDELRSQTSGRLSEDSPSPVHFECFIIEPMSNRPDAVMAFSTIDEGSNSSLENAESTSTTENYTDKPPEYSEVVHKGTHSPTFEYSDPEPFFDCRQAASDFSEPDEPDANIWLKADQSQRHLRHSFPEKLNRRVLLSSGSEDYEDAPFLPEPPHNVDEESKELLCYSEESDEEFSLCETAQPPPVAKIGTFDADTCLTRVR
ncbi:claspin-like [Cheilinus undulatus]|uniref:claspin-like n=1 Tax=Cheilinus undulatus TaxID=241271 RepID=UPI001BD640AD|nr:claspin-like [Cheilinus undulatus]